MFVLVQIITYDSTTYLVYITGGCLLWVIERA